MPRHKRQEGESCENCVSFERIIQRNPDMTVKIEKDPTGTCDCGPPCATTVPVPGRDANGKPGMSLQGFTTFPPTMRASQWCGQYERDPAKPAPILFETRQAQQREE